MSAITRHGRGTIVAGQSIGGRFAETTRTESSGASLGEMAGLPTLPDDVIRELAAGHCPDALFEVTKKYILSEQFDSQLVKISPDEHLTPVQVNKFLANQESDDLAYELHNQFDDACWIAADERSAALLRELGVTGNVDTLVSIGLAEQIRSYDTSDPLPVLARQTPPQLMRAPLADGPLVNDESLKAWQRENLQGYVESDLRHSEEAKASYLRHYLGESGVDISLLTHADEEAIRRLIAHGPSSWNEDVTLNAIWLGEVTDAAAERNGHARVLELGSSEEGRAHIALVDSRFDKVSQAELSVPIAFTVDRQRPAALDTVGSKHREFWDDVERKRVDDFKSSVNDVTARTFKGADLELMPDGRVSLEAQRAASLAITAELTKHRRELRLLQLAKDGGHVTAEQEAGWNNIHDRVSELRAAKQELHVNRGFVTEGSTAWHVMNNID